ncbi:diaminopimelate epimerase [Microvirga subterranea]|nr:diaminopimelate epimerase [Microvirga subterranea]
MPALLPSGRPFLKMHGLGNDFVVVDGRAEPFRPTHEQIRWICDRHIGVGGDQLLVIEPPSAAGADARMRIYNVDGAEAETCLNATRCVAWLLLQESGAGRLRLETLGGLIDAARFGERDIALGLPAPRWDWQSIPLASEADTLALDMASGPLVQPTAVNVGNPHVVCFVGNRDEVDVPRWAPAIQNHPMLWEGANVGVAAMAAPDLIRLVVWERPGILTRACGSGACAAVLAARRRGLTQESLVKVDMPGGCLRVEVHGDESVTLIGPTAVAFSGRLPADVKAA